MMPGSEAMGGLKSAVETLLFRAGPARIGRELLRGRVLVLAYHNVVPHGARVRGDRSLHLPLDSFEAQLDLLLRTHDVIPLASVQGTFNGGGRNGGRSRPRAVITFDDAYSGAVTVGVAAVTERGLPATIFVAPKFLGGRSFWWDVVPERGMTEYFREAALVRLAGRDREVRRWMEAHGWKENELPAHQKGASMEELHHAAGQPGITVASHSWSHPNLTRLSHDDLVEELRRPHRWLGERFENTLPWISYPYGLSSKRVEAAARAAGYRGALHAGGGWLPRSVENPLALPRQNVSAALSLEGFGARSAGMLCR